MRPTVYSYEIDRSRREHLASQQLSSHHTHRNAATSSSTMTAADLNSLSLRDLLTLVVRQVQERHSAEQSVSLVSQAKGRFAGILRKTVNK